MRSRDSRSRNKLDWPTLRNSHRRINLAPNFLSPTGSLTRIRLQRRRGPICCVHCITSVAADHCVCRSSLPLPSNERTNQRTNEEVYIYHVRASNLAAGVATQLARYLSRRRRALCSVSLICRRTKLCNYNELATYY